MLYTELLRLWDEAVKAVDGRDWQGALSKLEGIYEPTARTLFVTAAAHLALGQIQPAIQVQEKPQIQLCPHRHKTFSSLGPKTTYL